MNWKLEKLSVPKWMIFVAVVIILILACGSVSYLMDRKNFFPGVLGGLGSGFVLLLVDKWLDRQELQFLTNRDYLKGTIPRREDKVYYGELIKNSKKTIDFMGKTGVRFLRDFADLESATEAQMLLLFALQRKVRVRFLLANRDLLGADASKVDEVERIRDLIKVRHPEANFEIRFYGFPPAISYFRADDTVVFGANFPGSEVGGPIPYKSRHNPSVVASTRSEVSKSYIDFFDEAWRQSVQEPNN